MNLLNPQFVASLTEVVTTTSGFGILVQPSSQYVEWEDSATFMVRTNKDSNGATFEWRYHTSENFDSTGGTAFPAASTSDQVANNPATSSSSHNTNTLYLVDLQDTPFDEVYIRCFITFNSVTLRSSAAYLNVGPEPND